MSENPLAFIGKDDWALGFKALGFKVYQPQDLEEFNNYLEEIVKAGTALCLIEEELYRRYKKELEVYRGLTFPVFLAFSREGIGKILEENLARVRKKAIGV